MREDRAAAFAQMGERAVVMALAVADPGAAPVGEDERHEHDVGRQRLGRRPAAGARPRGRARSPAPRARAKRGVAIGEPGQADALAVAEAGEDRIRADLVPERMIGGDDPRAGQVGQDQPRQLGLELARAVAGVRLRAKSRRRRRPSARRSLLPGGGEGDGTTMAVCLNIL